MSICNCWYKKEYELLIIIITLQKHSFRLENVDFFIKEENCKMHFSHYSILYLQAVEFQGSVKKTYALVS